MGAAQQIEIHGAKGGDKKPKSPTEASDNLRSTNVAKLLIAVVVRASLKGAHGCRHLPGQHADQ